jgi:hypothetical protein
MLPTERAIQSRMKEAFDVKPNSNQWQVLIDSIRKKGRQHLHSKSEEVKHTSLLTSNNSIPQFSLHQQSDPITGSEMAVIYPESEEWVAVDQFGKDDDTTWVKESTEWHDFVYFLENYFLEESRRRRHKWYKGEDDSRAIPGGRYGCA